jgi:hypothetical protein
MNTLRALGRAVELVVASALFLSFLVATGRKELAEVAG